MSLPVIGFAGLTHLCLVSAVGTASKGFRVVGYDPDGARVRDIAAGRLPVVEPGLDDMARTFAQSLSYTDRLGDLGRLLQGIGRHRRLGVAGRQPDQQRQRDGAPGRPPGLTAPEPLSVPVPELGGAAGSPVGGAAAEPGEESVGGVAGAAVVVVGVVVVGA